MAVLSKTVCLYTYNVDLDSCLVAGDSQVADLFCSYIYLSKRSRQSNMKKDFFLLYDPSKSNFSISLIGQYFLISARFISEKSVLVVSFNPQRLMGLFVNSMLRSKRLP